MSFPLRTYRRYPSGGTAHYYITLPTVSVGSLFLTYTGLIGLGCEGVRAGTLDMLELDLDFGAARGKTRYEVSRSIMPNHTRSPLGMWTAGTGNDAGIYRDPGEALPWLDRPLYVIEKESSIAYATGGEARMGITGSFPDHAPIIAFAPPCLPDRLGDPAFLNDLGLRYPCYAGSMAHGIASEDLVAAMGAAGMLGFYGAAGLSLARLDQVVTQLSKRLAGLPFGINLINSPNDSDWERGAVDLFLARGITLIEASAYLLPTPALVKFRVKGITRDHCGTITAPNRIIAKVSRVEVARRLMEPPPQKILEKLVASGDISTEEASLAQFLPLAQDITAEADSGGHTDHRAALAILPSIIRLARDIQIERRYASPPRVGLAGGIGTPAAAAAAFSMGAAYIVTGSVNQACVESGTSPQVRDLLARVSQTDVTDAPAADMFEMGIQVQVLKKGTRFAERASKLYELYRRYGGLEEIPEEQRIKLEETIFCQPLEQVWAETERFFEKRSPRQLERALKDPKHRMALVFRWYLGQAVHWANAGIKERAEDYQVWCGPAMGAFNDWTRGTFLEHVNERSAPLVALNLLYGAALLLRLQVLRAQGMEIPQDMRSLPVVQHFSQYMGITEPETIS